MQRAGCVLLRALSHSLRRCRIPWQQAQTFHLNALAAASRRSRPQFSSKPNPAVGGESDAQFFERVQKLAASVTDEAELARAAVELGDSGRVVNVRIPAARTLAQTLKRRSQWQLLISLLAHPDFAGLVRDRKLRVIDHSLAQLLHLQFTRAAKYRSPPDLSHVLELASTYGALHNPVVEIAVRSGFRGLKMDPPPSVARLIDREPEVLHDLPNLASNSSLRKARIAGASVADVLAKAKDEPATLLSSRSGAPTEMDVSKLNRRVQAVISQDVYKVEDVERIAHELGTTPSVRNWSHAAMNAARIGAPTDSAHVILHVWEHVPNGYVSYLATHAAISALLRKRSRFTVSRRSQNIQLAYTLFQKMETLGGDRVFMGHNTLKEPSLISLITGMTTCITFPDRERAVAQVLDWQNRCGLLMWSSRPDDPHLHPVLSAALSAKSHGDALEASLSSGPLAEKSLLSLFGIITHMRFSDATIPPFEILTQMLQYAKERSFSQLYSYPASMVRGIRESLRLLDAEKAGLRPVNRAGYNHMPVAEQHISHAISVLRQLETFSEGEGGLFLALSILSCYRAHRVTKPHGQQLRSAVLKKVSSAPAPLEIHTGLIRLADTPDTLAEVWEAIRLPSEEASLHMTTLCVYMEALYLFHRYSDAIEFGRQHIPDDPDHPYIFKYVAKLMARVEGTSHSRAVREVFPLISSSPRTHEFIGQWLMLSCQSEKSPS